MRKIIGVTVGSSLPKPNFKQTDPTKGDYIKNKPDFDGLKSKVEQIEVRVDTIQENAYDDTELRGIMSENVAKIDTLNELVGNTNVATQIGNAVATLESEIDGKLDTMQSDIDSKVNAVDGMGLSTNDYTTAEKDKLATVEPDANFYEHPTHTSHSSGLYKVTVDDAGHVSDVALVEKEDIVALGIPEQDTTYDEEISDLSDRIDDVENSINTTNETLESVAQEFENYKTTNNEAVSTNASGIEANKTAIEAIQGDYLKSTDKTQLQDDINKVSEKATANASAIEILNGEGNGSIKQSIDNAFNEFAANVTNDDVVNTYKELIDYASKHGPEFTELVGKVDTINTHVGEIEVDISNYKTAVSDQFTEVDTTINNHVTDTNNPHGVTKEQIGLANVDNTSDIEKPISNAVQEALDGKANLVHAHSDLYYDKEEIEGLVTVDDIDDICGSNVIIGGGGDANVVSYATKQWVQDGYQPKGNYLTSVPAGYATESYVNTKIAAIPTPDVSGQINTHNLATDAHNDIRLLVDGLTTRLNTLADCDDTTLDQMSEVVEYIKSNQSLIEGITTKKVNVADIIDNLTTNVSNKPLSAAQGVVLKGLIEELTSNLSNYQPKGDYLTAVPAGYATEEFVTAKIAEAELGGTEVDLSEYVTESEMQNYAQPKGDYLTSIPSEYITEKELENKGYLTEHQNLSDYATKKELPTKTSDLINDSGFLTTTAVESVNGQTGAVVLDAASVGARPNTWMPSASEVGALPDTTAIPIVPDNISAFANDVGYLTEHQSLDGLATEEYVDNKLSNIDLDGYVESSELFNENNIIKQNVLPDGYPYASYDTILPETTLEVDVESQQAVVIDKFALSAGFSYDVTYNGTTYSCISQALEIDGLPVVALGNAAPFGGEESEEPFLIMNFDESMAQVLGAYGFIFVMDGSETITLSISGTQIQKMSSIFMPELDVVTNIVNGSNIGSVRSLFAAKDDDEYIIGLGATAFGDGTKASGQCSHAEGEDTTASGVDSHAEGNLTTASGDYSHAEGSGTTASEPYSHAEGFDTTASGDASHAEGLNTTASGDHSHAEGYRTTASGFASHAEGLNTTASGDHSHAEGYGFSKIPSTITSTSTNEEIIEAWKTTKFMLAGGEYSHVEGYSSLAIGRSSHAEGMHTTASGYNSHAEGWGATASGDTSHAEGANTIASGANSHAEGLGATASGYISHAEGYCTEASGDRSHAEGLNTTASGNYSHAEGWYTIASGDRSHVQGKCNIEDTANKYAHIVGNGESDNKRSNAHTLDWDGNAWYAGYIRVGGTSYDDGNEIALKSDIENLDYLPMTGGVLSNTSTSERIPVLTIQNTYKDKASDVVINNEGVISCNALLTKPHGWGILNAKDESTDEYLASLQLNRHTHEFIIREYRIDDPSHYEGYYLPAPDSNVDYDMVYNILTTKKPVAIEEGGTNAKNATDALKNFGLTATAEELNYCDGVTSNIQTQLDDKVSISRTVNGKPLSSNVSLTPSDIGTVSVAYGTCSTIAETAAKVVALSDDIEWELKTGSIVMVYFDNSNTASNVTLNVNGTGAYPIWYNNAEYTSNGTAYTGYAKRTIMYMFNGTHYVWVCGGYDTNTTYTNVKLGHGYATCSTAAATAAKVGTLSSYTLTTGGIVAVKFTNAVPAKATLNINSKGAKSIYYRGAAITADIIKAGDVATFMYNGSQYILLAIDRWQDDIKNLETKIASADASGTANNLISAHNINTGAHADIRAQINQLSSEIDDKETSLKTYTNERVASAIASKEQLYPEYASSIEDCTDINKVYVLPDGYIYGYTLTRSDPPAITIEEKTSGYWYGDEWNHTGKFVTNTSCSAKRTNIIPVTPGDQFSYKGYGQDGADAVIWLDASQKFLSDAKHNAKAAPITLTAPAGAAYVWFSSMEYANTTSSVVLEVKWLVCQAITESYQWFNTGHAFVPADYEDRIISLEEQTTRLEAGVGDSLKGKKIVYDGDSICMGYNAGGGYPALIASVTDSNYDNQAVGGARLCANSTQHSVVNNLANLPTDGDLYCFQGGINDFWGNTPIGECSLTDYTGSVNTSTICGAMETIFRYALTNFVGKAVCFVITHKVQDTGHVANTTGKNFRDYRDAMAKVCEKYSIPYYDAFMESGLNGWNEAQSNAYLTGNSAGTADGIHPNVEGYKRYYVPQLLDLFRKIMPV